MGNWYRPDPNVTWQWQLTGELDTAVRATLYDIDLFDASPEMIAALHNQGKKVLCYFSGGSSENWRPDADSFPKKSLGNVLDGWPDEKWLDVRDTTVHRLMLARISLAQSKGCDGVEPDNMDGYANSSGFNFTDQDQLAYNRFLANVAHSRGLTIALKNDLGQAEALAPYFDLAMNEQCHQFTECDLYQPFVTAGKPVLNVEYLEKYVQNISEFNTLCAQSDSLHLRTLILDIHLDGSLRQSCSP